MSMIEISQVSGKRTKSTKETNCVEPVDEVGLLGNLLLISKTTRALMGLRLAELGFHSGQDEALLCLDRGVPVAVSHLADKLTVRPSTVSKMMDRLIAKQLVVRTEHKSDQRRTMLLLTDAGVKARDEIIRLHAAIEKDLLSKLDIDDPDAVVKEFAKVQSCLSNRLLRLR